VAGGFEGEEKDQVERHFLSAPERQQKVRVLCELLHHSATSRGAKAAENPAPAVVKNEAGWFARFGGLWRNQPMLRFATTMAALVIVAGLVFWRFARPTNIVYPALTLTSIDTERGGQNGPTAVTSVKLDQGVGELPVRLLLPAQTAQPNSYRAELVVPGTTQTQNLRVVAHDSESVTAIVPTSQLKSDRYTIRLFGISADGREERVRGSYLFRVE